MMMMMMIMMMMMMMMMMIMMMIMMMMMMMMWELCVCVRACLKANSSVDMLDQACQIVFVTATVLTAP